MKGFLWAMVIPFAILAIIFYKQDDKQQQDDRPQGTIISDAVDNAEEMPLCQQEDAEQEQRPDDE